MSRVRAGVSLVEVIVAVALLGMIATVHTMVSSKYILHTRAVEVGVDRAAAVSTAVDLYATMPYTALTSDTGCVVITSMPKYRHQRCVSLSNPTQAIRRVRIIIVPTTSGYRSDTVYVDRSLPPTGSLFS